MSKVPAPRTNAEAAKAEVSIAQLTAQADLILVELRSVIGEMANMLRRGAGE